MSVSSYSDQGVVQLPGEERGIPSVNETKSLTANRRLIVVLFLLIVGVIGGFGYRKYIKNRDKMNEADAQKALQLTNAVPSRTFVDPSHSHSANTSSQLQITPSTSQWSSHPHILPPLPDSLNSTTASKNKLPLILDKSGSSLMAVAVGTQSHNAHGETSQHESKPQNSGMAELLSGTHTPIRKAEMIGNRNFILAKGSFIDGVLQTRLDSTVPGMTACVITRDIYSDNGKVLLIERGSTMSGEYKSNMTQGMARIFVLWTRIKTPNGVIINLDSPGTDQLGGSGLPGYIDNHFWQRFGGALMLSLVDDTMNIVNAKIAQGNTNTNQFNFNSTTGAAQNMATEALKNTINIPPTLYKNQGEQIGIYIARDLDFSKVYDVSTR